MFNRSFYPKHIFLSRYLPKKGGDFFHDNGTPEDGRVLKYIKSILYLRTVSSEKNLVKNMHHGTSFHLLSFLRFINLYNNALHSICSLQLAKRFDEDYVKYFYDWGF